MVSWVSEGLVDVARTGFARMMRPHVDELALGHVTAAHVLEDEDEALALVLLKGPGGLCSGRHRRARPSTACGRAGWDSVGSGWRQRGVDRREQRHTVPHRDAQLVLAIVAANVVGASRRTGAFGWLPAATACCEGKGASAPPAQGWDLAPTPGTIGSQPKGQHAQRKCDATGRRGGPVRAAACGGGSGLRRGQRSRTAAGEGQTRLLNDSGAATARATEDEGAGSKAGASRGRAGYQALRRA